MGGRGTGIIRIGAVFAIAATIAGCRGESDDEPSADATEGDGGSEGADDGADDGAATDGADDGLDDAGSEGDETVGDEPDPPPPSDNVIDVAIWPRIIEGGHVEIPYDPPEVLCRRM